MSWIVKIKVNKFLFPYKYQLFKNGFCKGGKYFLLFTQLFGGVFTVFKLMEAVLFDLKRSTYLIFIGFSD